MGCSMENIRAKVAELNSAELWESAELLGQFLISAAGQSTCSALQRASDLALFADAVVGLGRVPSHFPPFPTFFFVYAVLKYS